MPPTPSPPPPPPQRSEAIHSAIKLVINKSFKLTETLVALSNYEQIAQMKNAHRQILTIAQQQTNARLQPPILKAIIKSEAVMPYAIALAKA